MSNRFKKVMSSTDVLVVAFGAMIGWGWVVSSGRWIQNAGVVGITNNGTLNIYSGSVSQPVLSGTQRAEISLSIQKTEMDISENEYAYSRIDAIINYGTLTVNKNVRINIINKEEYRD